MEEGAVGTAAAGTTAGMVVGITGATAGMAGVIAGTVMAGTVGAVGLHSHLESVLADIIRAIMGGLITAIPLTVTTRVTVTRMHR